MTGKVTIYKIETGALQGVLIGTSHEGDYDPNGEAPIAGEWNGDTHYVLNGEVIERPNLGIPRTVTIEADNETAVACTEIPSGTVLKYDDVETVIEDGEFVFTTAHVSTIDFRFEPPWPHQPHTLTVTAVEPNA